MKLFEVEDEAGAEIQKIEAEIANEVPGFDRNAPMYLSGKTVAALIWAAREVVRLRRVVDQLREDARGS